ncbi:MAG: hypothetical protein AAF806_26460 [Bacteroidota bacterium]
MTINIYLRFALIGVFLVSGVILAILFGFWYSFPLLLVGLFLLVGYVLLGTVQSAGVMMQSMDIDSAEKRLNMTLNPKWLYTTNKAFYYMLKGTFAAHRKDMEESEKWLKKAQEIDVPTDNERAMIELQLANISANKGKWKQAEGHFRKVKKMNITEPNLLGQIAEFEKVFNQRGQVKAARRGGQGGQMMRQGGKRRRPKMR